MRNTLGFTVQKDLLKRNDSAIDGKITLRGAAAKKLEVITSGQRYGEFLYFFLRTSFCFGLTIAPIQNSGKCGNMAKMAEVSALEHNVEKPVFQSSINYDDTILNCNLLDIYNFSGELYERDNKGTIMSR